MIFLFLALAAFFVQWRLERTHFCKFVSQHYNEHFCEINLNLEQWFRRILFTLYHIETPFNAFANRADPDQGLLCLLWI